jgi:hypothetical protein
LVLILQGQDPTRCVLCASRPLSQAAPDDADSARWDLLLESEKGGASRGQESRGAVRVCHGCSSARAVGSWWTAHGRGMHNVRAHGMQSSPCVCDPARRRALTRQLACTASMYACAGACLHASHRHAQWFGPHPLHLSHPSMPPSCACCPSLAFLARAWIPSWLVRQLRLVQRHTRNRNRKIPATSTCEARGYMSDVSGWQRVDLSTRRERMRGGVCVCLGFIV